ncbi:glycosyltransferase family 2 protein [Aliivibrio kagoshimensis]|uniref:glycosyltransferase family 2 protein n=1 Tax=Aliivibrio kagoshimensis TaxID=2910230 RepID=UPI003D0E3949
MKVSIITVCYNSGRTIADTIASVASQTYDDIEYIVIDGMSSDNTNAIIEMNRDVISTYVSEKDSGLYDAMNKGIKLSTGDVIGILNSDDVFFDKDVIKNVVSELQNVDCVYADVGFYKENDLSSKVRHFSSKSFTKEKFSRGMMPAHPSTYVRRECYEKVHPYNVNYKIASDFDMLLRLFNLPGFTYKYVNREVVKMRLGGVSTGGLKSNYLLNKELIDSCRKNGLKTGWLKVLSKYPEKIMGLIFK